MIKFSCTLCANELQTLEVPKILTMLLQLEELKEEGDKIYEGMNLSLDFNSTKLSRGSSLLFAVIGTYSSLSSELESA